ncbi:hypothetical protein EMIT0P100_50020 [Pseudomonas sp. IT-P100]
MLNPVKTQTLPLRTDLPGLNTTNAMAMLYRSLQACAAGRIEVANATPERQAKLDAAGALMSLCRFNQPCQ